MSVMIIIEGPNGIRSVAEGETFCLSPDERVVGSMGAPEQRFDDEVEKMAGTLNIPVGDLISKLTLILGIPHCPSCEKRRLILNRIQEVGVVETVRKLMETFK